MRQNFFGQCVADAHHRAALELSFHVLHVDGLAHVVARPVVEHAKLARIDVHLDFRRVNPEHVIHPAARVAVLLVTLELVDADFRLAHGVEVDPHLLALDRGFRKGDPALLCGLDENSSALNIQILRIRFEQTRAAPFRILSLSSLDAR